MMLLNDFYTLSHHEATPGVVKATLALRRDHKIFEGHFPGLPIVPGVCMMQIVRELMEVTTKKTLRIAEADNMKFLSVINPDQNKDVEASLSYTEEPGQWVVNATLFAGAVTFFKLKATLKIA
ncbi:MAG TPA: 3-hydroxyacyl-ACP dehydratase [Chryseolinea sp.]